MLMLSPTCSQSAPQRASTSCPLRSSEQPHMKLQGSSSIETSPNVRWSIDSTRCPRSSEWRGNV